MRYGRCITIMAVTVLAVALAAPALAQRQGKKGGGNQTTITYVLTFDTATSDFWADVPAGEPNQIVGTMSANLLGGHVAPGVCMALGIDTEGADVQPEDDPTDDLSPDCVDAHITSNGVSLSDMDLDETADMRLAIQWKANGLVPLPWSARKWSSRWYLLWKDDLGGTISITRTGPDTWRVDAPATAAQVVLEEERSGGKGKPTGRISHYFDSPPQIAFTLTRCPSGGCQ